MIVIIKPGFLHLAEKIIDRLNLENNLKKVLILSKEQAQKFYLIHKDRPFFSDLIEYMISGLSIFIKVEADAEKIKETRRIIGNTDPSIAEKETLRSLWGKDKTKNLVHCSDSIESAMEEDKFFDEL